MGNEEITIERAFNIDALLSFSCGVRELDYLITNKTIGLRVFFEQNPCELYIISNKEKILGFFVTSRRIIKVENEPYDSIEIDFLAITKEERNKRLGTTIIKQIEFWAKENNCHIITVDAFVNNKYSAVGFYEKCNFIINGNRHDNVIPMIKFIG